MTRHALVLGGGLAQLCDKVCQGRVGMVDSSVTGVHFACVIVIVIVINSLAFTSFFQSRLISKE